MSCVCYVTRQKRGKTSALYGHEIFTYLIKLFFDRFPEASEGD